MQSSITLKAYCKINLCLSVIRRLKTGYHEIESVMQQINLYDTIKIKKLKSSEFSASENSGSPENRRIFLDENKIVIRSDSDEIPLNEKNICYKAAALLKKQFKIKQGIEIYIKKRIPVTAGLAGGSTDAAATMIGMNNLFNLRLSKESLAKISEKIGMDVAFCIIGRTCLVTKRGEELKQIKSPKKLHILIINPGFEISTKEAYQSLDLTRINKNNRTKHIIEAIEHKNVLKIASNLQNDFEYNALKRYPILQQIKKDLIKNRALNAVMSGSGPTIFGIFPNKVALTTAYLILKYKYKFVCPTTSV